MIYCKKCGAELADGSTYCPKCGSMIEQSSSTVQEKKTEVQVESSRPIQSKASNDILSLLRKIMFYVSIAGAALIFLSMLFNWIAWVIGNNSSEWQIYNNSLFNASRYIGAIGGFAALGTCGLLIAQTIMSGLKIRKSNLKEELPRTIVNGVISILVFIFFILVIARIFSGDGDSGTGKWAKKLENGQVFLGLLTAMLIYTIIYAWYFNKPSSANNNTKMLKTSVWTIVIITAVAFIPWVLTLTGGFKEPGESSSTREIYMWYASYFTGRFVVALYGFITFFMLSIIAYPILNKKTELKKNLIIYGSLALVMLVMWIVCAVMFRYSTSSTMPWNDSTVGCTVVLMLTYFIPVGVSVLGIIKSKEIVIK